MTSAADYRKLWQHQLCAGLDQMQLTADGALQAALLDYLALLWQWNQAFNLTAIRDPQQMVARQLLDCLAILPQVQGPRLLDVGSGAGLPGIPLALARPDWQWTLLDANGKKIRFIQQVVTRLGLANVTPVQARLEDFRTGVGFDTITARAFAAPPKLVSATATLRADTGCWALMLGRYPAAQVTAWLDASGHHYQVVPLVVPDEPGQRHLLLIR
ncbi:MAG: 16S rRNA (guanine(527)-N(7))-methyltransferase RsmG [Pseudomonadota bacterium]